MPWFRFREEKKSEQGSGRGPRGEKLEVGQGGFPLGDHWASGQDIGLAWLDGVGEACVDNITVGGG